MDLNGQTVSGVLHKRELNVDQLGGSCDSPGALRLQGTGTLWEHIAGIFLLEIRKSFASSV